MEVLAPVSKTEAPPLVPVKEGEIKSFTGGLDHVMPPPQIRAPKLTALSKMGRVRNFSSSFIPLRYSNEKVSSLTTMDAAVLDRIRAALVERNEELLDKLLQENAHIVTQVLGPDGHYLLHEVVLCKSVALLDVLLRVPVLDVRRCDSSGASCVHWLCWFSDDRSAQEPLEVLSRLLQNPDVEVDARDSRGYTPLMFAVDQSHEPFVRLLLQKGADPDARTPNLTSPILIAVHHGSYSISEALLQGGASLDVAGEDGLSPLMMAVRSDNLDLVVFLVKSGATVEFSTPQHGTAKNLARSAVVEQFLVDSAFYQNHHDEKKKLAYNRIVSNTRSGSHAQLFTHMAPALRGSGNAPSSSSSSFFEEPPTLNVAPGLMRETAGEKKGKRLSASLSSAQLTPVKVYTSENFPLDLEYFEHPALGLAKLGMCMCPGRNKPKKMHVWQRDLQTDLQAIKDSGADVVVTLVRSVELLAMGIMELFVRVKQLGMESLHFPVVDKWIPESMSSVIELISKLIERVDKGQTLVIHW